MSLKNFKLWLQRNKNISLFLNEKGFLGTLNPNIIYLTQCHENFYSDWLSEPFDQLTTALFLYLRIVYFFICADFAYRLIRKSFLFCPCPAEFQLLFFYVFIFLSMIYEEETGLHSPKWK